MKDKVVGQLFPIYQADDPQGRPRAAREDMMMMIHRKPKQTSATTQMQRAG